MKRETANSSFVFSVLNDLLRPRRPGVSEPLLGMSPEEESPFAAVGLDPPTNNMGIFVGGVRDEGDMEVPVPNSPVGAHSS